MAIADPRLGDRARPSMLSSPTSLVVDIKESTTHAANLVAFSIYLSRARLPPTFWLSARHPCVSVSSPLNNPPPPAPSIFHHTPFLSHVTGTNPLTTNNVILQTDPYHFIHPHRPSMKQFGAVEARTQPGSAQIFAPHSPNGIPSGFCSACAMTLSGLSSTPPTGANPAARDAFKCVTKSRAAWLACSASFCLTILYSIGEANRLAISDLLTDTLYLSPREIIIAITVLHGTMTGAEVDALRQPLKKKLSAVSDLPSHIVAFRGVLARLATVGQAALELDAFRFFIATLSLFPVFHQYTCCLA